jgi:hypothetical protein
MSNDDNDTKKTEDDQELRERIFDECRMPDGETIDMQKLRAHSEVDCVPIYGGPVAYNPPPGMDYEPSAVDRSVEQQIAEELPCKHCDAVPVSIDSDGKVEPGCCEGCPHEGSEMYPHAWIRANRRDRDEG